MLIVSSFSSCDASWYFPFRGISFCPVWFNILHRFLRAPQAFTRGLNCVFAEEIRVPMLSGTLQYNARSNYGVYTWNTWDITREAFSHLQLPVKVLQSGGGDGDGSVQQRVADLFPPGCQHAQHRRSVAAAHVCQPRQHLSTSAQSVTTRHEARWRRTAARTVFSCLQWMNRKSRKQLLPAGYS